MKGLFKVSTLAISVFAASQAGAIELYNNEGTTAGISGVVAAQMASYGYDKDSALGEAFDSENMLIEDPGSYLNIDIRHQQGSFYGLTRVAWDLNFQTSPTSETSIKQEEPLSARETYAGFGHDDFGAVTIGRQTSPYMKTDKGFYTYWAGGFNQSFSDELGSRRALNAVVWQNDFDNLYVGLQYQAKRSVDQIAFGNGGTYGEVFVGDTTIDSGFGAAIAYTFESTGTYIAAAYNRNDDINGDLNSFLDPVTAPKTTLTNAEFSQYSVAAEQHFMDGGISLSARYEHYDSKDGAATATYDVSGNSFGIGANMYLSDQWRIFANYEMGKEESNILDIAVSDFSMFAVGTAYAPVAWGEVYLEAYNDKNEFYEVEAGKGTHVFLGAAVFF
ncbi:porin [Vibrio methylphosphonaticus]|uniref:porin n=1 Tax=Vibrio methylphosphonaticus TaxID=2946866 RepID=UPI002029C672|nr:porin [Vibrio methylphosphonaticus]MCL9773591.1 porin [Vibrio methylphosphonaticus]